MKSAKQSDRAGRPHRVVMLGFENAQILDITGPLEVFARTTRWLAEHAGVSTAAYEIELVCESGGPVVTSGGLTIIANRAWRHVRAVDTLLVAGGIGAEEAAHNARLLQWIRTQSRSAERFGSVCTGAFVLAAAGLLEGHTATTHWAYCRRLARLAPGAMIEPDALFVRSGRLCTSAGVTAGMDLALALVEEDWGSATALAVAQELVMFVKRPGGQSQFSRHLEAQRRDDVFGQLQLFVLEHLDADLSVAQLAERTGMSDRHFAREFARRVGMTPAAYVTSARIEAARQRLAGGARHYKRIARDCGFGDEQNLRRAFRRALGITPQEYQARFGRTGRR